MTNNIYAVDLTMVIKRLTGSTLVLFLLCISFKTAAFGVVIDEKEFSQLQRHCQLFYASTSIGRRLGYAARFSESELKQANKVADQAGGAWHYCAGLVHLKRAQQTADKNVQQSNYKRALAEIAFTSRNIKPDSQYFGEVQLNMARALFSVNEHEKSAVLLRNLIQEAPNYLPAYIESARQVDKQGKTPEAIVILNSAPESFKRKSADLNYFLGIYYLKVRDFENAKRHARIAYANGYPLPGLKNMLAKQGHSL
ncbi:hypothetical protein [Rheinheimera sp.]|uniref:hypothetical protein n=1 Tax=Rheinheimera sp. TaxID=1869214 RepID=UPI002FDCAF3C